MKKGGPTKKEVGAMTKINNLSKEEALQLGFTEGEYELMKMEKRERVKKWEELKRKAEEGGD